MYINLMSTHRRNFNSISLPSSLVNPLFIIYSHWCNEYILKESLKCFHWKRLIFKDVFGFFNRPQLLTHKRRLYKNWTFCWRKFPLCVEKYRVFAKPLLILYKRLNFNFFFNFIRRFQTGLLKSATTIKFLNN